jgi:hypothetical protein
MKNILVFLIAITASLSLLAANGFSSLEEQMTGKEFKAAGLEKLSPQELAALNDWIRSHSLGSLAVAKTTSPVVTASEDIDRRGLPSDDGEDDSPIESRIIGNFSGWDGQTVFKLENGMIWVQDDKDKFHIKEVRNPAVTIEQGLFNSWKLSIEGHKDDCKVRRIQ